MRLKKWARSDRKRCATRLGQGSRAAYRDNLTDINPPGFNRPYAELPAKVLKKIKSGLIRIGAIKPKPNSKERPIGVYAPLWPTK